MEQNKLKLHKAVITDLELTYKWASDPNIRQFFFSTTQFSLYEHKHWFENKLTDVNCLFFIASYNQSRIGLVRFDQIDDRLEISYVIDPNYQGLGLGSRMLSRSVSLVCRLKKRKNKSFQSIIGYVKLDNTASIRAFEKNGFSRFAMKDRLKFVKNV